ncbi:MAG: sulfatase family protein [Opitutales bacterium]
MRTFRFLFCTLFLLLNIASSKDSRPNIVILYADDMGHGDLAIQNPDSKIPTPTFDQLAREGMRFTDGHSSSGICTPSRYALLTGRHHWRKFHGITHGFSDSVFSPERLTLPEMLQEQGYHTAHVGKWHLGMGWNQIKNPDYVPPKNQKGKRKAFGPDAFDWSKQVPNGPLAHGFDYSFTDCVINFPPYTWLENDKVLKAPDIMMNTKLWKPIKEGNWECRPGPMVTDWDPYENIPTLTEKALDYIHRQGPKDQPFFLYFALPSPHAPIIPNDEFDGKSEAGAYGDFVFESDDACGKLIQAIKDIGEEENTVIIFTADNGSERYMMERFTKFNHNSSGDLRGMKRHTLEGGHRVPFVVKWPGVTEPGSVSDAIISQVDIMATLASALGYTLPEGQGEDGYDMMPVLAGKQDSIRDSLVLNTYSEMYGIRQGDWVFIQDNKRNGEGADYLKAADFPPIEGRQALFNLREDLGQRNNVIQDHPEKVEQLEKLLSEIRETGYPSKG